MRAKRVVELMLSCLALLMACTGDGPVAGSRLATVTMRFITPATVRSLVVEVTGPGIVPAVVVNIPVGADTVATGTLTLPSGSGRRFLVTAVDSTGAETHRADTTITLQPGANPSVALVLEPSLGTFGLTVTFGGVTLSVPDTSTRVLAVGDSVSIDAVATRANGDTIPYDSLDWGSSNPVALEVAAGLVRLLRSGSADVTVSYEGATASIRVTCPCNAPAVRLRLVQGPADGSAGDVLQPIVVEAVGADGSRVSDFNSDVFVEFVDNPTNTWLLGETVIRAVNGVATFDAVGVGLPGDGYRIRARAGDLHPAITAPFAVSDPTVTADDTAIGASFAAYCALGAGGEAYCWGANGFGQLGTGDLLDNYLPTPVLGGLTFRSIALGNGHACAVTPGGDAYCWGRNQYGSLGDGTTQNSVVPRLVQGGHAWSRVDLGTLTTCGLTTTGQAYCWGYNNGRMGTGDSTHRAVPTPVNAPVRFTSLSVGAFSACGVTAGGWVYCWGLNSGRFGNGRRDESVRPVIAAGGLRFSRIVLADLVSSGQFPLTCGITVQSEARCWGVSRQGQFGDGIARSDTVLVPVSAMSGLVPRRLVAMEGARVCAIDSFNRAYCWGQSDGAIGDGEWVNRAIPTAVAGNMAFTSIATGNRSTCAITVSGVLYCWGTDRFADGDGAVTKPNRPVRAEAAEGVVAMTLGKGGHACANFNVGATRCWGRNALGQVGNGTQVLQAAPVSIFGEAVSPLALMREGSCGLRQDGQLWCWGTNSSGQLGLPRNTPRQSTVPVQSNTTVRFTGIVAGDSHGCGIDLGQRAVCWGNNTAGQAGTGNTTSPSEFLPAAGDRAFTSLAAGWTFTCGISTARVFCWGSNGAGQIGIGTSGGNELLPRQVLLDADAAAVSAGQNHACLVTTAGAAYCWGTNSSGQLGDGSTAGQAVPVPVVGGFSFTQLAAGAAHTCGLTSDGRAFCWGANTDGQLGNGTYVNASAPVEVATTQRFTSLTAGVSGTCGITTTQSLYCWGSNADGQLLVPMPLAPAQVPGTVVFRVVN